MSEEKRVSAVRSLYDAAIHEDEDVVSPHNLPTEAFGVTLEWDAAGDVISVTGETFEIQDDDLTDNIIPDILISENVFEFDEEIFELRTGDVFELRST